ncbi:ABC transporter permease subunit [Bacillus sp. 03113]|uniref:ABC transporter permease subunit n=1 Tax=Bacillus sp. 03113 TaxID=2578211 RepID=UPI0011412310|nr:ABC transporter permease subunit [Bacillus sp. 03113]
MIRIQSYELKKAFTSPIVIALTILFLLYNFFIIFQHTYFNSELKIVNKLVEKFGYEINDSMIYEFQAYYQSQLDEMNQITNKHLSKTYDNTTAFFKDQLNDKRTNFSKKEEDTITSVMLTETYIRMFDEIDREYDELNMAKMAEYEIERCGLSGEAAETAKKNYSTLGERLDKLIANEEHKNMFFIGKIYQMHSLLFKTLFRTMVFEIMILVVLITGYILTYEFENNTHLTAYSSKRGRKLTMDKLLASIAASLIVTTLILGVTLGSYFIVFNYSGLWQASISSYFNAEKSFPYISWWKMTFTTYLIWTILLIYVCQLCFTAITFMISIFIRNSYFIFCIFAILLGLGILIPGSVPTDMNAIFITRYTPFSLILNPHLWFIGWGPFSSKYYEINTVAIWIIMLPILCLLGLKRFKKQSIY